ncbi:MAG: thermonuclease family protein [Gemmatimonadota bacterium]|nr:thermonuclease family protein [Gemmatimonadota bacterium]
MRKCEYKTRFLALSIALALACQAPQSKVADRYPHYAAQVKRVSRARIQVIDGDTFRVGELRIRVLGLDSPEIGSPRHGYFEDQPYGREARAEAVRIIGQASLIEYLPFRNDKHGRLLAHVFVDGELFAVKMIGASLAYETVSFYGDNGFYDLAREIRRAADRSAPPPFIQPHLWRKTHRSKR